MITLIDGAIEKRLEDFGLFALKGHEHSITPELENKAQAIPGRPGLWHFGAEIGEKVHTLPIGIVENDRIELQRKLNDFVSFLFDGYGKPKLLKLIYDYEPDKFYTIRLAKSITPDRITRTDAENEVIFISEDPYKYSNVYSDEITWGSEVITFDSFYLLGHENPSADMSVTAPGNVMVSVIGQSIKPTIELSGSATNLVITANDKTITVGTFSNATWVIDCEHFISYKDGIENMLDMGNFILKSGDNAVSFAGDDINITLTIRFRDRWL